MRFGFELLWLNERREIKDGFFWGFFSMRFVWWLQSGWDDYKSVRSVYQGQRNAAVSVFIRRRVMVISVKKNSEEKKWKEKNKTKSLRNFRRLQTWTFADLPVDSSCMESPLDFITLPCNRRGNLWKHCYMTSARPSNPKYLFQCYT